MALADLVLEGLTLILVIALGAVLIGGLTYLSSTVASANEAKLVGMGTYIYIPAAVYVNGALYVPMYNIGHYTVVVRQLFIMVGNTLINQTLNTTLAPRQYYVYTTTLNQRPTAVTVVVSPTVELRLKLEFSANVTEPGQVTLMPMGTNTGGNGLIEVVVNDPQGAGWVVAWSYAGQSYSVAKSTTYTWYLNPPYVPIQITFKAQITSNPTGYTCQIQPSQVTNTYGSGSEQVFNVTCGVAPITVTVSDNYGAGWVVTWSGVSSGSKSGSASASWTIQPSQAGTVSFTASITSTPSGYTGCSISPTSTTAGPGQTVSFTVSCSGGAKSPGYYVYVTVTNDTLGAQWTVSSSVASITGSTNVNNVQLAIGGPTDTLYASITGNPSGYTCSINPTTAPASSNVHYTFTVNCIASPQSPPSPPPQPACTVSPSAIDNVGGASGASVNPSTTQSIAQGKSVTFTWGINKNPVGGYYFDHWEVYLNGQLVKTDTSSSTSYTFTCNTPGTYSLVGEAVYMPRYIKVGGGSTLNPPGNGTYPLSQVTTAYFTWSDPLFIDGSWTASTNYQSAATSLTLTVTLNDYYSASGTAPQLSASTTLALQSPAGLACYMGGISKSGSINSKTASSWLPSITVQVTCYSTNGKSG